MKILFIHGLASSGAYKTATSLHHLLKPCEIIAPDLPIEPEEAFDILKEIQITEHPDLIVGLSMGGFWAQKLRGTKKILINPDFHISYLLSALRGEMKYLSPRKDGATSFTITDEICRKYRLIEKTQFDGIDDGEIAITWGMFATHDELVNCGEEFNRLYPGHALSYPGAHLPTHPELKDYLVPLAEKLMNTQF